MEERCDLMLGGGGPISTWINLTTIEEATRLRFRTFSPPNVNIHSSSSARPSNRTLYLKKKNINHDKDLEGIRSFSRGQEKK